MISAKRSLCPSTDPPSVEKGESLAAEAKAATLGTEDYEIDTESQQMVGGCHVTYLPHCRAIYMACRQGAAVKQKPKAQAKMKADITAEMLEKYG